MIVKIQPPNPGIMEAVRYNERKMNGEEGIRTDEDDAILKDIEDGHILATRNVPEDTTFFDEIDRLCLKAMRMKKTGPKIKNTTFHMSVNPLENELDNLDEKKAVELIDEIMKKMGYESQPYRIYLHNDIGREHYHVVSTRAGQDGKKIDDGFEILKLRTLLRSLEEKYGFEIILNEKEAAAEAKKENKKEPEKKKEEKKKQVEKEYVPSFSRKYPAPVVEQLEAITKDALKWHFSTFEQFQVLMARRYRVNAALENEGENGKVVLSGMNSNYEDITPVIDENVLRMELSLLIKEKTEKEKMYLRKDQKKRIETLTKAAFANAKSYDDFIAIMEKKGVYVIPSWDKSGENVFGLTYLDRATKCAWKASETSVTLEWLKDEMDKKGWSFSKDENISKVMRKNDRKSRVQNLTHPESEPTPAGKRKLPHVYTGNMPKGQDSNADITRNKRDDVLEKNEREKENEKTKYIE